MIRVRSVRTSPGPSSSSRTRNARRWLLALGCAAAVLPGPAGAQRGKAPKRPPLPLQRDSNNWRAYQVTGMELFDIRPRQARAYLQWAARLDPARPEPLFALGILLDEDSLLREALERDPFMHMGRLKPYRLEGGNPRDLFGKRLVGWFYLSTGQLDSARLAFHEAMKRWPNDADLLWGLALAYRDAGMPDSAEQAIARQRDRLRAEVTKKDGLAVYSLPFFEYMSGRAFAYAKQLPAARAAYGRALAEDLSYHPAHVGLALVALTEGDTAAALQEWDLAVSLAPDNASYRVGYAALLYRRGRHSDAERHAAKGIEAAAEYVSAYLIRAKALDEMGDPRAADAYREYLARAPAVEAGAIAAARERVKALAR